MRVEQLSCPACGAGIELKIKDQKSMFCPFCGCQFMLDNGDRTITKNVNINKTASTVIHKIVTNEASLEREKRIQEENKTQSRKDTVAIGVWFALIALSIIALMICLKSDEIAEKKMIEDGMIKVGMSSESFEGEKYRAIVEVLETQGFTNISTIDLDDAGLFKNKADTIDSVTINGNNHFDSSDYYYPDANIIITYH